MRTIIRKRMKFQEAVDLSGGTLKVIFQKTFKDEVFEKFHIENIYFKDCTFEDCTFTGCNFHEVDCIDTNFENCKIEMMGRYVGFARVDFYDCSLALRLDTSEISETSFTRTSFEKFELTSSNVKNTQLYQEGGEQVRLIRCSMENSSL